jgi:glucosamine--fructose-6-phosphate aminotransferase (isomerizing)
LRGLTVLPALQILGERAAQARNIDTVAPRHLTKVVMLA